MGTSACDAKGLKRFGNVSTIAITATLVSRVHYGGRTWWMRYWRDNHCSCSEAGASVNVSSLKNDTCLQTSTSPWTQPNWAVVETCTWTSRCYTLSALLLSATLPPDWLPNWLAVGVTDGAAAHIQHIRGEAPSQHFSEKSANRGVMCSSITGGASGPAHSWPQQPELIPMWFPFITGPVGCL